MLRHVSTLPESHGRPDVSYVARDMREFARNSQYDVVEVVIEGKSAVNICTACRGYIRSHPDQCKGIKAAIRGGKAYLYRVFER